METITFFRNKLIYRTFLSRNFFEMKLVPKKEELYKPASRKHYGSQFRPLNRWKLFFHADSRYLPIPQKIALASFYPLHKKSWRSQSLNELYNHFCEFQIFGGHFLTPTKESEWPRMAKMGLFALAFTSTGRYLSSVTLPVYLLHPMNHIRL